MKYSLALCLLAFFSYIVPSSSKKDSIEFINKIVGGQNSNNGEFPFMASWYYRGSPYPSCGGSLIAPNLVLSAAHCSGIDGVVKIGCERAEYNVPCRGVANVIRKIQHPFYNGLDYDYIILQLDRNIGGVTPINLNFDGGKPSTNEQITVIGFGTTSEGGNISSNLKKVDVPTNSYSTCRAQYGNSINNNIHLCAGYSQGGKDSCQGDSGGPAFMNINGVRTQVGVVSFGSGCARPNSSGVYARVSGISGWLKTEICNKGAGASPAYCGSGSVVISPSPTRPPTRSPTRSPIRSPTRPPTPSPVVSTTPSPTPAPTRPPTASPITPTASPITPTASPITPVPTTPAPTGCSNCDNSEANWMIAEGLQCDSPTLNLTENCVRAYWINNKICQQSCYHVDFSYPGDYCCDEVLVTDSPTDAPVATPLPTLAINPLTFALNDSPVDNSNCTLCDDREISWMSNIGLDCVNSPYIDTKCNKNINWINNKYCQLSCYNKGNGYVGDQCCVPTAMPTPSPSQLPTELQSQQPTQFPTRNQANCILCHDEENDYMNNVGMDCETSASYIERKCINNGTWRQEKFCQKSCYEAGLGYESDNCCN